MVLEVVIGDALIHLLTAPFRRIMMLQAVHLDLEEEHYPNFRSLRRRRVGQTREKSKKKKQKRANRRSAFDFRHMGDAARFLYKIGGIRFFFCGGALDVASVFLKYYLQVFLIIPLFRRLPPLPMSSFVLFSTFVHTAVLFFPVASVQCVVSALIVNRVTDYVRTSPGCSALPGFSDAVETPNKSFHFIRSFFSRIRVMMFSRQLQGFGNSCDKLENDGTSRLPDLPDMVTAKFESNERKDERQEKTSRSDENAATSENNAVPIWSDREEYIGHAVVLGSSDAAATLGGTKSRRMFLSSATPPVLTVVQEQATKRVRVSAMTPKKNPLLPGGLPFRIGVSPTEEPRGLLGLDSTSRRSSAEGLTTEDGLVGQHIDGKTHRLSLEMTASGAPSPSFLALSSGGPSPSPYSHYYGGAALDDGSETKGERFVPRFSSWRELAETLYHELPVGRFLKKMTFIEFMSRYFSSVVSNVLVSRLYFHLIRINYGSTAPEVGIGALSSRLQSLFLRRGIPLAVSIGVSLVTYPLATIPFVHFMRLAHYEYLRRESATQRLDEELNGYLVPRDRRSVTITPVVVSVPPSPAFYSSPHGGGLTGSGRVNFDATGPKVALWNEQNPLRSSNQSAGFERKETQENGNDENLSFASGRLALDGPGGSWLQVEMDENELLDENNLHYNRPRNLKTSISLGNWWVESFVLKLFHVDVRAYLSVIKDTHGFLALYNGWGGYACQLIFQSVAGELIQEAIAKFYTT